MTATPETPASSFETYMTRRLAASTAFVNGDIDPLLAISAESSPATIFGPAGTTVQGADQVNAANSHGAQGFDTGGRNEFEVMHQSADEHLAYWVGVQRSVVRIKGRGDSVPMALRVTEIFRRDGDDWKLVHRHADPLHTDD